MGQQILVVEDEDLVREFMVEVLHELEFEIFGSGDGGRGSRNLIEIREFRGHDSRRGACGEDDWSGVGTTG